MSTNPSDWAPVNETSTDLWLERSNLIGLTVLSSTAYGIFFCLYLFCLTVLIKPLQTPGRFGNGHRRFYYVHLAYTTAMFILLTLANGANARVAEATWIDFRNFPGGPNAFTVDVPNLRANVLCYVTFIMASWLQDIYVLYRFLVFSDWNYYLAIFPALIFLTSFGGSTAVIAIVNRPGTGIFSPIGTKMLTTWFCASVFLNVVVTLYVVGRLLWKRKAIVQALGPQHSKHYTSIAAMLIESAALYSACGIFFVVTFLRASPIQNLVLPVLGVMEGISPLLIIYRVATGRAWAGQATLAQAPSSNMRYQYPGSKPRVNASDNIIPLSDVSATKAGSQKDSVWSIGGHKKDFDAESDGIIVSQATHTFTESRV